MHLLPLSRSNHPLATLARIFFILALTAGLTGIPRPAAASPAISISYVVDSNEDNASAGPADGSCNNGMGYCTLREAIKEFNSATESVGKYITFSIHDTSINLTLGTLVVSGSNITITGPGIGSLSINGSGNLANSDNLIVQGNHDVITDLAIRNSRRDGIKIGDPGVGGYGANNSLIRVAAAGNTRTGIYVHLATNTEVTQTLVGSTAWANNLCATGQGNLADGVVVDSGSSGTVISSSRVVCNGASGIYISGAGGTTGTQVIDSSIGTDGTSFVLGNGYSGIEDYQAAATQIHDSVISRNGWYGVWLHGSTNASLFSNKIGTTAAGNAAMANAYDGILISDNAAHNVIGSDTVPEFRNVISGNSGCGITLTSGANNTTIAGNAIGVGVNGTTAVPNALAGVAITGGAHDNFLSSYSGSAIQIIAGNTREGIYIESSNNNIVHISNYVGIAGIGTTPRGNGLEGIRVVNATGTLIEGHYAYNGKAGIAVEGNDANNNMIAPTSVYANGGLPVDLGNDGFSRNGSHTAPGPNSWQNYPVFGSTSGDVLYGTTCNGCYVFIYQAAGNPAKPGGGGNMLALRLADGDGNWSYPLPTGVRSSDLSAIACTGGLGGNCSEMSPRPTAYIPLLRK